MLYKDEGLLLQTIQHSDNGVILKVFTLNEGLQSYYHRLSKKHRRSGLFEPLALLELVSWKEVKQEMHTCREIRLNISYHNIGRDVLRNTVVMFLNEILLKCLKHAPPQPDLYLFFREWLQQFDLADFDPDSHLHFIAHLSAYLGFFPNGSYHTGDIYFDLQAGSFVPNRPLHNLFLEGEIAREFDDLFDESASHKINPANRKFLLHALVEYLRIHIPDFGQLKSLAVVEEIFR